MKKLLSVFTLLALLFCFVSCDDASSSNDTNQNDNQNQPEKVKYTISWIVEGKVVETDTIEEGTLPEYNGTTPAKAKDVEFTYTFKGWDKDITAATANTTYTAVFDKVVNKYSITFNSNGGEAVSTITKDYNSLIEKPTDPKKDGYRFVGWCTDSKLENPVAWPITLTKDQTLYAKWNEKINISAYLDALLESYNANPLKQLPETLVPGNEALLVTDATAYDYSNNINISNIKFAGYAQQWNMIVTNLMQSQTFLNLLTVVESVSSTAVAGFNNYLDTNVSDTANYTLKHGIYDIAIKYENNTLDFVISYSATLPGLGEQKIEIQLSFNTTTLVKDCRIQIGDANALRYEIDGNKYSFAIKYLGVRNAFFTIEKNANDEITGSIAEYLGVSSAQIKSYANFKITKDYATCTGNKADGMIGFTGTICEMYDVKTGKLIAYEVNEDLSSIEYNTLWFNLSDTSGITSIKAIEESNGQNPHTVYINGSTDAFEAKKVGGLSLKTASRRYDIELRSQYFYYLNSDNEYCVLELKIPMLFIQAENLETLKDDIEDKNDITFNLNVSEANQKILMDEYEESLEKFDTSKEQFTIEYITNFIG